MMFGPSRIWRARSSGTPDSKKRLTKFGSSNCKAKADSFAMRWPLLISSLVIGLCVSTSACRTEAQDRRLHREENRVWLEGRIDQSIAERLASDLTSEDRLIIRSPGGDRRPGLEIAKLVSDRDVEVIASGGCASACAFIFLAARKKSSGETTRVMFHSTPRFWVGFIENRPDLFTPEDRQHIRDEERMYDALLRKAGIQPEVLDCIDRASQPAADKAVVVLNPLDRWRTAGPDDVRIPARYGLVILSKAVLVHYGLDESVEYWDVPLDRRDYFAGETGTTVAWIDDPAQCEAPTTSQSVETEARN